MMPLPYIMVGIWTIGITCSYVPDDQAFITNTPGLHNVIRVTEKLLSGSVPEGDAGFQSLQKLGVKTIISVDGARPDVERARQFGMRYVHLPIGYDGVPTAQGLKLAKAVRDLPGVIYIHCHHGKHRSPAASAYIKLCLDEKCTVQSAIELMKQAGTDPKYLGLYASAKEVQRPSREELNQADANYPEIANTDNMVQRMVEIDKRWEHLKLIRKAGWVTPKNHPDLDPPHEALLMWEHYVEMGRLPELQKKPHAFLTMLKQAQREAKELETALRQPPSAERSQSVSEAFSASATSCTRCHSQYRDIPQK